MSAPGRPPEVLKSTGQRAPFSAEKLYASIRAAGATKALAEQIVGQVRGLARPGIRTLELRQLTAALLRAESPRAATRYELRNAVLDLGPTGYWFENLIGALYAAKGYRVEVGKILEGRCISHEVDVIAQKQDHRVLVECKFRNGPGMRCDSKVALYVQARAVDLKENREGVPFDSFCLVANTKFTSEAIRYANCVGLDLLGWDHPSGRGLQTLIEEHGLHPLTCLTTLTEDEKRKLLKGGAVLSRELGDSPELLDALRLDEARIEAIVAEVAQITRDHRSPEEG